MLRGCFGLFRRLGCLVLLVLLGLIAYQWVTWPDVERLSERDPRSTAFMDSYADLSGSEPEWQWVSGNQIAKGLKHAVLVGEDIEFLDHSGFAIEELQTAVEETVREGKPLRGASTITQQLARMDHPTDQIWVGGFFWADRGRQSGD